MNIIYIYIYIEYICTQTEREREREHIPVFCTLTPPVIDNPPACIVIPPVTSISPSLNNDLLFICGETSVPVLCLIKR